jgi:hypothetical protein
MKHPPYQKVLAIILGTVIIFLPDINPVPYIIGIFYLSSGILFGFLWPTMQWRWGLWISGPMVLLLGLSLIFAGFFDSFLKNDLPILITGVVAACAGAWAGTLLKRLVRPA